MLQCSYGENNSQKQNIVGVIEKPVREVKDTCVVQRGYSVFKEQDHVQVMKMYKGTIIENSLANKDILKKVRIIKTWRDDDWILHNVLLNKNQILDLSHSLDNGPWYIHVWQQDKDDVKVIYRDKIFDINFSDKSTWHDAIEHGKSLGIPEGQLDFLID